MKKLFVSLLIISLTMFPNMNIYASSEITSHVSAINTESASTDFTQQPAHNASALPTMQSAADTNIADEFVWSNISAVTDFTPYASDNGYTDMGKRSNGTARQNLYNKFLNASKNLWTSTKDIKIDSNSFYVIETITNTENLTIDEIVETYWAFKNDHPIFYFASNSLNIIGNDIFYCTDAEYATSAERIACKNDIISGINEFGNAINGKTSNFDIIITIHDMINDKIDYAYESDGITPADEPWAHNIMGYFTDDISSAVCEGYARALELALNMANVENYFVTGVSKGQNHAWNYAQFDDGKWYYIDATWNDMNDTYKWFAKGTSFELDHTANTSSSTGVNHLYDLPAIGGDSYEITQTISLSTAQEFKRIELNPSGTFELISDIDFSDEVAHSDGATGTYTNIAFAGTLNGNGYSIKGLHCGLFTSVEKGATIDNVKLVADFSGSAWNGETSFDPQYKYTIAYANHGTITNSSVSFTVNDSKGRELQTLYFNGLFYENYGKIAKCSTQIIIKDFTSTSTSYVNVTGLVADNFGIIQDCAATIDVQNNQIFQMLVTGIAEKNGSESEGVICLIDRCTSVGNIITVDGFNLSYAGMADINYNDAVVQNCKNYADVICSTGQYLYAGGIVAWNAAIVKDCINYGDISNKYNSASDGMASSIGGICGTCFSGDDIQVTNCTNYGNISGEEANVGGISGNVGNVKTTISNCINQGNITNINNDSSKGGIKGAGGIVGTIGLSSGTETDDDGNLIIIEGHTYINNCSNSGDIIAEDSAGCIVGFISILNASSTVSINKCYNCGQSTNDFNTTTDCYGTDYSDSETVTVSDYVNIEKLKATASTNKSNVAVDGTVTFTTTVQGGIGPYTYSILVYDVATDTWKTVASDIDTNTYTWTADNTGNKEVYIDVTDALGLTVRSNVINISINPHISGLYKSSDGQWYYFVRGEVNTAYSGLVQNSYGWWYVKNGQVNFSYNGIINNTHGSWYVQQGKVDFTKNGLLRPDGKNWYYFINGKVQTTYTGLIQNTAGWWYVKNGQVDFSYNGIISNAHGSWYVQQGKVDFTKNGLLRPDQKNWYYFINGKVQTTYTGLIQNTAGWWYVKNGQVDFSYNGIISNAHGSWYVQYGKVDFTKNGLLRPDGKNWYYFSKGKVQSTYTGLVQNTAGQWYVENGQVNFSYKGIISNAYGSWYVQYGKVQSTYTGLVQSGTDRWYIKNGQVDLTFTGMIKFNSTWVYITNGKLDSTYTGMAKNEYGWWHMTNGKLDLTYTGISSNQYGWWYMTNGKLDTTYTGTALYNGKTYNVVNGKVIK